MTPRGSLPFVNTIVRFLFYEIIWTYYYQLPRRISLNWGLTLYGVLGWPQSRSKLTRSKCEWTRIWTMQRPTTQFKVLQWFSLSIRKSDDTPKIMSLCPLPLFGIILFSCNDIYQKVTKFLGVSSKHPTLTPVSRKIIHQKYRSCNSK